MARRYRFVPAVLALLFLSMACNLGAPAPIRPTQGVQSSSGDARPTAEARAVPTQSLPPPLASATPTRLLVDVPTHTTSDYVQWGVDNGLWAEGEGILRLLQSATAQADPPALPGDPELDLTPLVRSARSYLSANPDPALAVQIEAQLALLIPPVDRLPAFSRPAETESRQGEDVLARLPAQRAYRPLADRGQCSELWAAGFDTSTPLVCFLVHTIRDRGTTAWLYLPVYWPEDDPRRARVPAIVEAIRTSLEVFNDLGPSALPNMTFVLTDLMGVDRRGARSPNLLAAAVSSSDSGIGCYVGIFPSVLDGDDDQLQQTMAHEIFHCYQFAHLSAQESGPDPSANEWWVEGSAEYFSNVVYPDFDLEHTFLWDAVESSQRRILTQWDYEAYLWFQFLENQPGVGRAGILAMLAAMPVSGSFDEQTAALARIPLMTETFHQFGQAFLDKTILDTNGGGLLYDLAPGPLYHYGEVLPPESIFDPPPFFLGYYRLQFDPELDYQLNPSERGDFGRSTLRPAGSSGGWSRVMESLSTACGESQFVLLVTQTAADALNEYVVELNASSAAATGGGCDSCLIGRWQMNNASYLTHLNALADSQAAENPLEYTAAEGAAFLEFGTDRVAHQSYEAVQVTASLSMENMDGVLSPLEMGMTLNGSGRAGYEAADNKITYTSSDFAMSIETTLMGQPMPAPVDSGNTALSDGLFTGAQYTCAASLLTLKPFYPTGGDLPALQFDRVP